MFSIRLIRSKRKTISIEVAEEGVVTVRAPRYAKEEYINAILKEKEAWIRSAIEKQSKLPSRATVTEEEKERLRELSLLKIPPRVDFWSNLTGLAYSSVRITSAQKRFGSCSSKNSLCFSLFLANYPEDLLDYVIVHELCHTKVHNHSSTFYELVESILPDWRERERRIRSMPLPRLLQNNGK